MDNEEQIKKILADYAAGKLSAPEIKKIEHLIVKYPLGKPWDWRDNAHRDAMESRIKASIEARYKPTRVRKINVQWMGIAAACLICVSIVLYLYFLQSSPRSYYQLASAKQYASEEVLLIMPNGEKHELGATVSINDIKQKWNYRSSSNAKFSDRLTIKVPAQRQCKLLLEDGTKVWLNAGTTLKLPMSFSQQAMRTVDLAGEGYFEVFASKIRPFKVIASGTEVKVTGTKFNVQAFGDEPTVKASLVEGHVDFCMDAQHVKLRPGFQVIANKSRKEIQLRIFDSDKLLSWKDGYFVFDNMELVDVMKTVSRWYNISVVSKSPIGHKKIGGTFPNNVLLTDFLKDLTLLSGVEFKVNGKEVEIIN